MNSYAGQQDLTPQERAAKKRRLSMNMTMLESDIKKQQRAIQDLAVELRRLERDRQRLVVEIEEKERAQKKAEDAIAFQEGDLKRLKKELNLL